MKIPCKRPYFIACVPLLLTLAVIGIFMPAQLLAQRLKLRVLDLDSGQGIADAVVTLSGSEWKAVSDRRGWIFAELPSASSYEIAIIADGYHSRRLQRDSVFDQAQPWEIFLRPAIHELPPFLVSSNSSDEEDDAAESLGSASPIHQLSGDALRDPSNDGIADTLERVVGVTTGSEDGALSGISIRGAGARQTRITIDGQSAAGGGGRGTTRGAGAAGQIPREFLERIQVMKAPTPDLDADAIGGTINLQTSRVAALRNPRSSVSLRSSYADYANNFSQSVNITHAQPFALKATDRRIGLLVGVNFAKNERSVDVLSVLNQWPLRKSPQTGEPVPILARLRAGSNHLTSDAYGLLLNTDLQYNRKHRFYLKAAWNDRTNSNTSKFQTTEFIRGNILSLQPQAGKFERLALEKQFTERTQQSRTASLVLGSEHSLADWNLQLAAGFASAESITKDGRNALFRTDRIFDGSYDISRSLPLVEISRDNVILSAADLASPEPYSLSRYDLFTDEAADSELSLRVDLQRAWELATSKWTVKGGLKSRIRNADNDRERSLYRPTDPPPQLETLAASGRQAVFKSRYPIGSDWSPTAMEELFQLNPQQFSANPMDSLMEGFAGDFAVEERIHAGYLMAGRETARWIVIAGLRVEHTFSTTDGYETTSQLDADRQRVVNVTPVSIDSDYDHLFPSLHILHRPAEQWFLRTSVTRTLQRPDFRDLSPSMRVNLDNRRIRSGNPALQPFTAKALDIGLDWIPGPMASISFGVFYKQIDDFIVDIEMETVYLGEAGFIQAMPINGSSAELYGIELAARFSLPFLPGALTNTELTINYTHTGSEATYPGLTDLMVMLPEQVRDTFNIVLRWHYERWMVNLRSHYRGLELRQLVKPDQDQYNAPLWNHSISIGYRLSNTFRISFGAANLNRPEHYSYLGSPQYLVNTRSGSRMFSINLNASFGGARASR